jgi:tetratricopeptide (TPR) repeat protein
MADLKLHALNDIADAAWLDRVASGSPLFAAALAAHRRGQIDRARPVYLELMDNPALSAACLHQLGVAAGQGGDNLRAIQLIAQAIRIHPRPLFYQNLAVCRQHLGDVAGALDALIELGCLLQQGGQERQAILVYRHILGFDACRYAAHVNMGTALARCGEPEAALAPLLRGVALHVPFMPELAVFLAALVPVLAADGFVAAAAAVVHEAVTGRVDLIDQCLCTLGKVLTELGYLDAALRSYRLALQAEPGLALAHWNLSLALLAVGDYAQGWKEYEWRWHWNEFPETRRRLPAPLWRGEDLAGRTILVYGEQGYGDTIQFAPLAQRLAATGARVLFEVTTRQVRLMRQSLEAPGFSVLERGSDPNIVATTETFDYVVPLMSLPERLDLREGDLPMARAWLDADAADRDRFSALLPSGPGLRVGLAWAGRPEHSDDHKRSLVLAELKPLFDLPGITFVSLMIGPRAADLAAAGLPILDLAAEQKDFADTAAIIAGLDLVIAVDTAVAHLAAAMGKPVWLLLASVPDWRWRQEGGTTPWYPNMRLFRQPRRGSWAGPVASMRAALAEKNQAPR